MENTEDAIVGLSYEEREQLTLDFVNGVKLKDINAKYHINPQRLTAKTLGSFFVPIDSERKCVFCDVYYKHTPIKESLYSLNYSDEICPQCGHHERLNSEKWINGDIYSIIQCPCPSCTEKKNIKIKKIDELKNSKIIKNIKLDSISEIQKVFLLFVMVGEPDLKKIPWRELSGYSYLDNKIWEELHSQGLLQINAEASVNAFDDTLRVMRRVKGELFFEMNLEENIDFQTIYSSIVLAEIDRMELWQDLVLISVQKYIEKLLKQALLECSKIDSLNDVLFEMMGRMSEAQIKTVIFHTIDKMSFKKSLYNGECIDVENLAINMQVIEKTLIDEKGCVEDGVFSDNKMNDCEDIISKLAINNKRLEAFRMAITKENLRKLYEDDSEIYQYLPHKIPKSNKTFALDLERMTGMDVLHSIVLHNAKDHEEVVRMRKFLQKKGLEKEYEKYRRYDI